LTNPSGHFSGDYISAIRGCCPLKFKFGGDLGVMSGVDTGREERTVRVDQEKKLSTSVRCSGTMQCTPDQLISEPFRLSCRAAAPPAGRVPDGVDRRTFVWSSRYRV